MMFRPIVAAVALVSVFGACDTQPTETAGEPLFAVNGSAALNRDLAAARAATARFQDVNVALAEGYQAVSECVEVPGLGGMGIHFGNFGLLSDATWSPEQPEVLLYQPQADGSLKLVGVEFVVMQQAWHAAGNTAPPAFHSRTFDADPPGMYTLHSWVWANNPKGIFEPFNPKVTCPVGTTAAAHNH